MIDGDGIGVVAIYENLGGLLVAVMPHPKSLSKGEGLF
jgi:hypothetical protein